MEKVRLIANIFAIVGWLVVIIGAVAVLVLVGQLSQLSKQLGGGSAFLSILPGLGVVVLTALGPFALWALLTSLSEMHQQGERLQELLSRNGAR